MEANGTPKPEEKELHENEEKQESLLSKLLTFLGFMLIFFVFFISAGRTTMTCERSSQRNGTCEIVSSSLFWSTTRQVPLETLRGAEVVKDRQNLSTVVLHTRDGDVLFREIPIGAYRMKEFSITNKKQIADQINAFLSDTNAQTLLVIQDERRTYYLCGTPFVIFALAILVSKFRKLATRFPRWRKEPARLGFEAVAGDTASRSSPAEVCHELPSGGPSSEMPDSHLTRAELAIRGESLEPAIGVPLVAATSALPEPNLPSPAVVPDSESSRCLNCDAPIGPGDAFCAKCGHDMQRACSTCGASLWVGDRFCGKCGARVEARTDVEERVEKAQALAPEPSPELDGEHEEGCLPPAYEESPEPIDLASAPVVWGARDLLDSGQNAAADPEPSAALPVPERRRARWPFVVGGVVVLLLAVATGAWLWLRHGWAVYGQAHAAYRQGDCQAALLLYGRLHNYPRLAGPFVDMLHQEEAECVEYAVAGGLAAAGAHAGAISKWEQLRSDEPDSPLAPLALQAIVDAYGVWAGAQRQAGDFQAALATSDELAAHYPAFQTQADADMEATYLVWGDALCAGGSYDQAAQVYDAMAERGEPFGRPARLAWAQVMLDWGAALAGEGAYAEAEGTYRALLQREHGWLAPLAIAAGNAAGLESYGQVWTAAEAPGRPLRAGPGEQYATLDVAVQPGEDALDILGASAEAGWYAVRLAEVADSALGWLPVEGVGRVETGYLGIPLSGTLASALAASSDTAARAVEGLRALYRVWAATVDSAEAALLYVSLSELAPDEAARQAAWQQALEATLEAARALAERGEYTESISRTMEVELHDLDGPFQVEARQLRAANRLALGDKAAEGGDWEWAIGNYEAVLVNELYTYGVGQATVADDGALLREAPSTSSEPVFSAPLGWAWPMLGRSGGDGAGWILLLVPDAPAAQVWISSEYVALSVPFETLPERDPASPLPLLSHRALMARISATLSWAGALEASGDWEAALSLYQEAIDRSVPGSAQAASGLDGVFRSRLGWAAELAASGDWQAALDQYGAVSDAAPAGSAEAQLGLDGTFRTRLAWAADLSANQKWLEAVDHYEAVLEAAPDGSQPSVDALAGLEALAAQAESLAADTPCDAVPLLDALTETAFAARAAEALPGALLQCGQTLLATDLLAQAEAQYLRILAEFPEGEQAAVAQRGVQRVAWVNSIDDLGLYDAAAAVCEKAGAKVQAKVSTLDKPWVACAVDPDYYYGWDLPDSWIGEERQTTVVVCVGEEQESQVEVCPGLMVSGPDSGKEYDLIRIRYYRRVRLVDPVAGLTVAAGTIYGSQPDVCHPTETFAYFLFTGRFYHYGDHPDNEDLVAWIMKYLKP
jgi:hypothetical protein